MTGLMVFYISIGLMTAALSVWTIFELIATRRKTLAAEKRLILALMALGYVIKRERDETDR